MPSAPNAKVIGGQSITLECSHSHGNISWYKDGSDVLIGHGKILTIHGASPNDEGMYHCAEKNGLRGSLKVLVIGGCFKIKVKFLICHFRHHENVIYFEFATSLFHLTLMGK